MSRMLHESYRAGWVFYFFFSIALTGFASEPSLVVAFSNERIEFGPGDIVKAVPVFPMKNVPAVAFQMAAPKSREFGAMTAKHIGERVDIVVCGKIVFSPLISTPILSGTGVINSKLSFEEASEMADLIQRGSCD